MNRRSIVLVGTTIAAITAAPSAAHAICSPSQQTLPIVDDGMGSEREHAADTSGNVRRQR